MPQPRGPCEVGLMRLAVRTLLETSGVAPMFCREPGWYASVILRASRLSGWLLNSHRTLRPGYALKATASNRNLDEAPGTKSTPESWRRSSARTLNGG